ncbi:MAG: TonB-dependent receptor domain-containing protein [Blastocatellia bacterium]
MRRLRRTKKLASAAIFLMAFALLFPITVPVAMAQATTGSLRGVVTDSTGAVIPDADVTAMEAATGSDTKTKSNSDGLYNFPRLKPGVYTLVVQKQGYKKQEFQQVTISLGQDTSIDAALQAGQLTETVTVTASGEELIQKEQVQVSTTFEARKVAELPSNIAGGGIDTLALLSPGVIPGVGNVNGNGTTFSVNGNRARSNNFTIDGGDNNDLSLGGPNYFVDNQDIVAEFQVITNNFSAEYGRNQGAVVNIVTKSGTNAFHGTGFEYHRNRNFLDTLDNIEKRGGKLTGPTPRIYNVFGGTIGGPILKDRLFFFGSFQEIKDRISSLALGGNPAIAPEDLAKLETLPGYSTNPALQALRKLSAFAVPNAGGGTVTFRTDKPTNEIITLNGVPFHVLYPSRTFPQQLNAPEFSARGDWRINNNNSIWFRQLYQKADNINFNTSTASAGNMSNLPVTSKISSASWTSQLSNTSVNEFKFIYNRLGVIFGGGCEGKFATCIPDPVSNMGQTLPNIAFTGIRSNLTATSLQTVGPATNLPQGRVVSVYQFQDNFSKTLGRHQLKMGVDIRKLTNTVPFLPNVNGAFTFNAIGTTTAAQALIQNRPQRAIVAAGQVTIDYGETDQFYYLQDDWRIKDNLTLNLGMRYEYTGQPINTLNKISVARESDAAQALWKQSLPLESRTEPQLPADKNNFAPRLGFAWRPRFGGSGLGKMLFGEQDKTVISGGYSIAYDPVFYNIMLNISTSSPMVFNSTTLNTATGTVAFPLPGLNGQAVQEFAASSGIVARNTYNPKFFNETLVAPNFHSPYSQQWSLRIQREIARNNVVEVRYVGTHGVSLFATHNGNPRIDRLRNGFTVGGVAFPGFPGLVPTGVTPQVAGQGGCVDDPATPAGILNEANTCVGRVLPQALLRIRDNTAQSIYHALQARYDGRIANQLNFGLAYTWSKALDNASEVFAFNDAIGSENPFDTNGNERGYSQFDRRHAFAANFIWDIPLLKNNHSLLGKIAGGWQLNGTYLLTQGQRFTPFSAWGVSFLGTGYSDVTWDATFIGVDSNRPYYGNPKAPRQSVGISQVDAKIVFGIPIADPKGFYDFAQINLGKVVAVTKDQVRYIVNGPGAAQLFNNPYGTVGRNNEAGPILNNLNLGIYKNFKLREKVTFRLSMDAFNAFNHPNPGIGFLAGGATPGAIVENAGINFNLYGESEYSRRAIQLGAKIIF